MNEPDHSTPHCTRCGPIAADPEGDCPRCGRLLYDPVDPLLADVLDALQVVRDEALLSARVRAGTPALIALGAAAAVGGALTGASWLWMSACWALLLSCFLLHYQSLDRL